MKGRFWTIGPLTRHAVLATMLSVKGRTTVVNKPGRLGLLNARPMAVLLLVVVAGCSSGARGPQPSPPTRTLVPDIVSLTALLEGDVDRCTGVLTLESAVVLRLGALGRSPCAGVAPTPLLFGYREWLLDNEWLGPRDGLTPSLILSGLDGDTRWIGVAIAQPPDHSTFAPQPCYRVYLGISGASQGAWLEGDQVHLGNGPVLPIAADFLLDTHEQAPWPLSDADYLCLDVDGRVTYATTPAGS